AVGAAWDSAGPSITATRGAVGIDVRVGASFTDATSVLPHSTAPYRIGVDAATEVVEVLVLGADGVAGAPGGGTQVVGPEFLGLFCVTGSCECPQGPALGAVEIPPGGPI